MINSEDYTVKVQAERIENYGNDGWIPIRIKDKFDNGRYKIRNKLGFGSRATVWVARDYELDIAVSIKVFKAANSPDNRELRILQHIEQQSPDHPGREYLPKYLRHFNVHRNGKTNRFIVLELLGPQLRQIHEQFHPYNPSFSRRVSKQLLLAIDCLHSYGIVHGDIHEGNVLFCLPGGYKMPLDKVSQGRVKRVDGAPLCENLPSRLVEPLFNAIKDSDAERFRNNSNIKLIDFSSSFFEFEAPEWIHTRSDIVSPEVIVQKPPTKAIDIWSLGCLTFYIATGRRLLETIKGGPSILPQIYAVVGSSPAPLDDSEDYSDSEDYPDLEGLLDGVGISDQALSQYIRKALVVDPVKRATTSGLRQQEFVQ
ncbi:kinase-like domain-containing protein [Lophiotrema nucula]|uniref:Kinase-like domain-containing protein n=1 Tax=Lophiotrema nucula TaxID=690887 RepID=A0A6A5YK25_9PLEO|nr:kinase-like domain-containing protein [Lophiotrema nucula]